MNVDIDLCSYIIAIAMFNQALFTFTRATPFQNMNWSGYLDSYPVYFIWPHLIEYCMLFDLFDLQF